MHLHPICHIHSHQRQFPPTLALRLHICLIVPKIRQTGLIQQVQRKREGCCVEWEKMKLILGKWQSRTFSPEFLAGEAEGWRVGALDAVKKQMIHSVMGKFLAIALLTHIQFTLSRPKGESRYHSRLSLHSSTHLVICEPIQNDFNFLSDHPLICASPPKTQTHKEFNQIPRLYRTRQPSHTFQST